MSKLFFHKIPKLFSHFTEFPIYSIILTALGAYWIFGPWEWALIRGRALIKFSSFSASVVCLCCNKTINGNNKPRRCHKARFLLASLRTSFGIPDERTPKDVWRVKKNSDDDSRTGRWLWWSLMHWWSKTLLFITVIIRTITFKLLKYTTL